MPAKEVEPFLAHVAKRISLTETEQETLLAAFQLKRVKKRQFIIQPDFTAKHRSYVLSGAFRAYVIDEAGEDHTIQFAIDDWWISDYNSYIYQQPATMFVIALEDSQLMQIDFESEQRLKAENHHFETFFRIMAERTAAFHQKRIVASLTQSAEERYKLFLEKYPQVVQRVPQFALASYLGMTTQFLSKIRSGKASKS